MDCKMGQKKFNLFLTLGKIVPGLHVVKLNKFFDPIAIGSFGMDQIMMKPHIITDFV